MNYNTSRPKMIIPEYGRHIQKLIDHAVQLENREERNEMAQAIIDVMGQLNPHLRDVEDFKHKLWDHIHIMSDFKLDVDAPYDVPKQEELNTKPNIMPYPKNNIRFKHYGRGVEQLVDKAVEMEDGEEKIALIESIANLMKKHYLSWSRSSVDDEQIKVDLKKISRGNITVSDDLELIATKDISTRNNNSQRNRGKTNKKRKRKSFGSKKKF